MSLLANPQALLLAILAVTVLGMSKGGFLSMSVLATPLLALAMPPTTAVAMMLPVLMVQDLVGVWAFRKTWDGWCLAWTLPGGALGVALGTLFAASVSEQRMLLALGVVTLVFGLYRLWLERGGRIAAPSSSPGWVGTLFGTASGFTSQVAHAGAPPLQMWLGPRRLSHEVFIGTSGIFFAAVNWMKVPAYLALGQFTRQALTTAAVLLPLAIASTYAGVWLVRRVPAEQFYRVIYLLLIGVGGKLAWDGAAGLLG